MKNRHLIVALCAFFSFLLGLPALAAASPTVVEVRIEGAAETLFEGPLAVEPHGVLASSDTSPTPRRCDGINALDPGNVVPAPTPTSAAADAMSLIGQTFDGKWYDGFDDYFITRFGPDAESGGRSWGIQVNDTFTSVGGCQYQLGEGDEVLWIYNAFNGRPTLALYPESETAGGRPLTATATLGRPFEVEVVAFGDGAEGTPAAHPGREGSTLFAGAAVAPVTTAANGFERVEAGAPATVVTDAEGKASITFTTPGWHRIKATVPGATEEEAIRSNRLDVCVPASGASDCGALPAEDQVRTPPSVGGGGETPGGGGGEDGGAGGGATADPGPGSGPPDGSPSDGSPGGGGSTSAGPAGGASGGGTPSGDRSGGCSANGGSTTAGGGPSRPTCATSHPAPLRVVAPRLDRSRLPQGLVGVSWKVRGATEVRRWTVSSQVLGRGQAPYVGRASGTSGTSALLRLPRGHAYRLRLTIVDARGRASNLALGKVVVPGGRRG
jgi:hypothetical protein